MQNGTLTFMVASTVTCNVVVLGAFILVPLLSVMHSNDAVVYAYAKIITLFVLKYSKGLVRFRPKTTLLHGSG